MKIKNLFVVAIAAFAGLVSCDLGSLNLTTNLKTNLNTDIPLEASSTKSVTLNSDLYFFGGTGTIDLKDNSDLKDQLDKLKSMETDSASFEVNGLPDGKGLYSITFIATVVLGDQNFEFSFYDFNTTDAPITNGSVVKLSAEQVNALNSAFTKWEELGFKDAVVSFGVTGTSDFDLTTVEVPPTIKFTNAVSVKAGV